MSSLCSLANLAHDLSELQSKLNLIASELGEDAVTNQSGPSAMTATIKSLEREFEHPAT